MKNMVTIVNSVTLWCGVCVCIKCVKIPSALLVLIYHSHLQTLKGLRHSLS